MFSIQFDKQDGKPNWILTLTEHCRKISKFPKCFVKYNFVVCLLVRRRLAYAHWLTEPNAQTHCVCVWSVVMVNI